MHSKVSQPASWSVFIFALALSCGLFCSLRAQEFHDVEEMHLEYTREFSGKALLNVRQNEHGEYIGNLSIVGKEGNPQNLGIAPALIDPAAMARILSLVNDKAVRQHFIDSKVVAARPAQYWHLAVRQNGFHIAFTSWLPGGNSTTEIDDRLREEVTALFHAAGLPIGIYGSWRDSLLPPSQYYWDTVSSALGELTKMRDIYGNIVPVKVLFLGGPHRADHSSQKPLIPATKVERCDAVLTTLCGSWNLTVRYMGDAAVAGNEDEMKRFEEAFEKAKPQDHDFERVILPGTFLGGVSLDRAVTILNKMLDAAPGRRYGIRAKITSKTIPFDFLGFNVSLAEILQLLSAKVGQPCDDVFEIKEVPEKQPLLPP